MGQRARSTCLPALVIFAPSWIHRLTFSAGKNGPSALSW